MKKLILFVFLCSVAPLSAQNELKAQKEQSHGCLPMHFKRKLKKVLLETIAAWSYANQPYNSEFMDLNRYRM